MEGIGWIDKVSNEEVSKKNTKRRTLLGGHKEGKAELDWTSLGDEWPTSYST